MDIIMHELIRLEAGSVVKRNIVHSDQKILETIYSAGTSVGDSS